MTKQQLWVIEQKRLARIKEIDDVVGIKYTTEDVERIKKLYPAEMAIERDKKLLEEERLLAEKISNIKKAT